MRHRAFPHHRPQPFKQSAAHLARHGGHLGGGLRVAGPAIGDQGNAAHLHDLVGRDGRQHFVRPPHAGKRQGHQMRGMRVDDAARFGAGAIDALMQHQRLGRLGAGHPVAVQVDLGQIGGVQPPQASVGGRDEPAIIEPGADVAGRAHGVAALIEAGADDADFFADAGFISHEKTPVRQGCMDGKTARMSAAGPA
ncbi:hypothetical protein D3C72_1719460 [compost metagenome]